MAERLGVRIRYSAEPRASGNWRGARASASKQLAPLFLVVYGDSYLPIDYTEPIRRLEKSSAVGLIVVYDNRFGDTSVRNNVLIDGQLRVIRYGKGTGDPSLTHVEAGVLAFRREVLGLFPEQESLRSSRTSFRD